MPVVMLTVRGALWQRDEATVKVEWAFLKLSLLYLFGLLAEVTLRHLGVTVPSWLQLY